MRALTRILGLALILSLSLPAWSIAADDSGMLASVKKRGVMRVGFSTFVPWAMQDRDGKFIGFEIDVATRLAKDLGVKAEFIPTKWAGIIPALLTGQFDIIIAGMSVTPERAEKVDFSIPYDYAGMDIVANKQKAAGFSNLDDFNKPEVVLSARTGGSAKAAIEAHMPKATVRYFDEEAQALQEVLTGRAHAFISSAPLPAFQAAKHPDILFRPLPDTFTKEPVAFALRKGDAASLNELNAWIEITRKSGWLKERKQYWFETTDWEPRLK